MTGANIVNGAATQDNPEPSGHARQTSTTLQVEIFGSTYSVRSDRDAEHIAALAELVDQKMREIASQTVAVETSRIAILAALNIADELARERERKALSISPLAEQASSLLDQLEGVLTSSS